MQGGSKRSRKSATLNETERRLVAAKYSEESRNTRTLPTGDDVLQQWAECRSGGSVRAEGAGRIQLLECPLCPGSHPRCQGVVGNVSGYQRMEESIEGCLTRTLVDRRGHLTAR